MVKDLLPGAVGSAPSQLLNLNGLLVFTADDGTKGVELFRSNGQVAGTVRVKDSRPGATGSYPTNLYNLNSTLFYSADDGVNGRELWKSTAFGPGTQLAADINPGADGSDPAFIVSSVTTLFFAANDGASGSELWTFSNPTAAAFSSGLSLSTNSASASSGNALRVSPSDFNTHVNGWFDLERLARDLTNVRFRSSGSPIKPVAGDTLDFHAYSPKHFWALDDSLTRPQKNAWKFQPAVNSSVLGTTPAFIPAKAMETLGEVE
jgi:ELWxxDGT repeat protein